MASVDDCRVLNIRSVFEPRGTIAFVEGQIDIPFQIKRVYYTFDIPSSANRAGHAHKTLQQLYIAASGAFDVHLDDGKTTRTVTLSKPNEGLFVGPGIWREINGFSANATILVLASDYFDEDEYIRDHKDFLRFAAGGA